MKSTLRILVMIAAIFMVGCDFTEFDADESVLFEHDGYEVQIENRGDSPGAVTVVVPSEGEKAILSVNDEPTLGAGAVQTYFFPAGVWPHGSQAKLVVRFRGHDDGYDSLKLSRPRGRRFKLWIVRPRYNVGGTFGKAESDYPGLWDHESEEVLDLIEFLDELKEN